MQLEALKIFCDIVRSASFSQGAQANGISQSAASQTVLQLENRLGVKLIDRRKRPLVLTEHGRVYYEGCRELLSRYFELEDRVRALGQEERVAGTVKVAAIYSVAVHHLSPYVRRFSQQYPEANARLEYLHPTKVIECVTGGVVDLGLISFPKKWPELTVIPWRDEPMRLALPPDHRLARVDAVEVRELDGAPLVHFERGLPIRRAIDRFLRAHHIQMDVAMEFDNIENIKRAVEAGAGVAILPEPTLVREREVGTLAAVPFRDAAFSRPVAIIHRKTPPLSLAASRFVDLLAADAQPPAAKPEAAAAGGDARR